MSLRTILIGCLAVVAGTAAAVAVRQLSGQAGKPAKTVSVVVARADMPRGQTVQAAWVTTQNWPEQLVPEGTIATAEQAIGRATLLPQVKGQLVFENSLAQPGVKGGLAVLIPEGMRAFTIPTLTQSAGVAGFIQPGNKVDVLLAADGRQSADGASALTLLQKVEILAVDQDLDAPSANKVDTQRQRSVTLLVDPEQAAKLSLAQQKGVLHLSLRNPQDQRSVEVAEVSLGHLGLPPESANGQPRTTPAEARPEAAGEARRALPPPAWLSVMTLRGSRRGQMLLPVGGEPATGLAVEDGVSSSP